MKKKSFFISIILGLAIFVLVFWKIGLTKIITILSLISPLQFLLALCVMLLAILVSVLKWRIILKTQGYNINFIKLFFIKLVGYSVSYIIPSANLGGEPARVIILKKESDIPLTKNIASVIVDKSLELTIGFLFLLLAVFLLLISHTLPRNTLAVLLFTIGFFLIMLYLFYTKTLSNKGFFSSIIRFFRIDRISYIQNIKKDIEKTEEQISRFFRKQKKEALITIALSVITQIIFVINYKLIFSFLGYNITITHALLILSLSSFAYVIPIPGAIGTYELAMAVILTLLGMEAETGVAFSLIIRCLNIVIVSIGMTLLSHFGIKLGKIVIQNKKN
jgi:hypothetical protein